MSIDSRLEKVLFRISKISSAYFEKKKSGKYDSAVLEAEGIKILERVNTVIRDYYQKKT